GTGEMKRVGGAQEDGSAEGLILACGFVEKIRSREAKQCSPDRCPAQSAAVKMSYPTRSTHVRATCDAGLLPIQHAHGHSRRVDPDRPAGGLLRNRGHR